jgi:hypothetical protein
MRRHSAHAFIFELNETKELDRAAARAHPIAELGYLAVIWPRRAVIDLVGRRMARQQARGKGGLQMSGPEGLDEPFVDVDEELTASEEDHLSILGRPEEMDLAAEEAVRPPPTSAFFTDPPPKEADLALEDDDEGSV